MSENALHKTLIESCKKRGFKTGSWRREARKLFTQDDEWKAENYEDNMTDLIKDMNFRPDAWRLFKLSNTREPRLQIEFVEVCVSAQLSKYKLLHYLNLFWVCEGSDNMHFHLYKVDQYGCITHVLGSIKNVLWIEKHLDQFNKDY